MTNQELEEISKEDNYSWIKVKRFNPSDCNTDAEEISGWHHHHKEETEFLIAKCRELAKELNYLREQYYGSMEDAG